MKHYISLIRKSDFTDLFKYGYLYIDVKAVVEFDGDLKSLSQNPKVRNSLFRRMNQFDYTFSVLLVYFISDLKKGRLNIAEVQNIFALDAEAKKEIEISYDSRIRIDDPIWPNIATNIQERFHNEDVMNGAQNLWKILKIGQPLSEIKAFFPSGMIREFVHEVQNDVRPKGKLSFWVYLLRYERHGFFPKNTAGFFMDLVNIYINALQGYEQPAEIIESTSIYPRILEFQNHNMVELIKYLESTHEGITFIEKVNESAGKGNNSFKIAILFLVLKSKFIDGFNLSEMGTIRYGLEKFPEQINYAIYLLGVFLGNSHTFECLYESLPLPIFKTLPPPESDNRALTQEENVDSDFGQVEKTYECESDAKTDDKLGGLFGGIGECMSKVTRAVANKTSRRNFKRNGYNRGS